MKFLVIRFSSIGDIVLTTPAIRCLKQQVANSEVHFLSKLSMKSVTLHNPYIDKFHYLNNDLDALIDELKQEKFDYIIDLHKNFRSYKIRLALKVKTFSYNKLSLQKFLLTKLAIDFIPRTHISVRCINALNKLGVVDDGKGLDYFIDEKEKIKDNDIPHAHMFGFVAIVIGAAFHTKKLPVYKLKQLCAQIPFPIILVGGKEEFQEGNKIAAVDKVKIYNACGKFSLNESADIVRRAKCVISHDTGLQYIACAFQKPVFAIWGATSPKLCVEPFYGTSQPQLHKNILVENMPCQPCSNYGTKHCPLSHFRCMKDQDVKEIAKAVEMILKK